MLLLPCPVGWGRIFLRNKIKPQRKWFKFHIRKSCPKENVEGLGCVRSTLQKQNKNSKGSALLE